MVGVVFGNRGEIEIIIIVANWCDCRGEGIIGAGVDILVGSSSGEIDIVKRGCCFRAWNVCFYEWWGFGFWGNG